MAVGAFSLGTGGTGFIATRKRPGHFVALSEDGRIDATLSQNGLKLADALEKRAAIPVDNAQQGANDLSTPLGPAGGVKSIDPYDVTIVMPALDGEPVVSDADREVWWVAGLAGAVMGVLWNYAMSSMFIWRTR